MLFSATRNLLPGSMENPDITVTMYVNTLVYDPTQSKTCTLNTLGYIPIVSTITGLGRALLGLVHTIIHLAYFIFGNQKEHHLREMTLGAINIGRGLVEVIPIIGNIILFIMDLRRMRQYELLTEEHIRHYPVYENQPTVVKFNYDKEMLRESYILPNQRREIYGQD